jgi:hypothetical protein
VEVSLGEDGSSVETELPAPVEAESPADADAEGFFAARSVAGPTINQINNGDNIRNYLQLIAVDKADGTIASFHEARKASASQSLGLKISGLVSGHTYGVLLLQGHWERDYAAETGGKYAYTNSPPTLLSTGYTELTYTSGAGLRITVWPMYVDTVFTTPGGLRTEPAVNAGKPRAVNLAAAAWDVNWKILRGSNGKLSGLDDLLSAQNAVGGGGYGLAARNLKAVVWTGADAPEEIDALTLNANTVTLPLAGYTGLPSIGVSGAVNFAINFVPFNVTAGWAKHDASSVFDLSAGPPEWVIRGGLNDLAQDDNTDFASFGKKPVTQANGNGAVRFTVAAPQAAAAGELVASDGTRTDATITFTASGYTGTAQVWYAAVPVSYNDRLRSSDSIAPMAMAAPQGAAAPARYAAAPSASGDAAPGYYAYTPLGDAVSGTYTKTLTRSANPAGGGGSNGIAPMAMAAPQGAAAPAAAGTEGTPVTLFGRDVYVVLLKDGKVGAPHKISDFPLTDLETVRAYLAANPHGGSPDDPVPLPVKVDLASEKDSLENLFELIAEKRKYVDLDLSLCTPVSIKSEPEDGTKSELESVLESRHIVVDPNPGPPTSPGDSGGLAVPKSSAASNSSPGSGPIVVDPNPGPPTSPGNSGKLAVPGIRTFDPRSASGAGKSRVVSLVLPDTAGIIPAASDGSPAFKDFTFLKTVRGGHITNIGAYAFQSCASLTQADFPAGSIGAGAFENCISLTQVNLPGAGGVGEAAFRNCAALTAVSLPAAVSIGAEAFQGCTALTQVSLPAAASIGEAAFLRCAALEKADLKSAAYIGCNAFMETGAKPLTITLGVNAPEIGIGLYSSAAVYAKTIKVDRPDGNIGYDAEWRVAFKEQLFGAGANVTLNSDQEFFEIPLKSAAEVRRYLAAYPGGDNPFDPVPLPVEVDLGNTVSSLANLLKQIEAAGKYVDLDLSLCSMYGTAFNTLPASSAGKDLVAGLILPEAAKSFLDVTADRRPFKHFTNLNTFAGSNVETPGDLNFQDLTSLVWVDLPALTGISEHAFQGLTDLTVVNIPLVSAVPDYAFDGCTALEWTNLQAATDIGTAAFRGCTALQFADFPWAQTIGYQAFFNTKSLKDGYAPLAQTIGDQAFRESSIPYANFPEATSVGEAAFFNANSLTAANFPKASKIGNHAFGLCTSLEYAAAPGVDNRNMGEFAFAYCTSLEYADLSSFEPMRYVRGLFYETGPQTLNLKLNGLEGDDEIYDQKREDHRITAVAPYTKNINIATDNVRYYAPEVIEGSLASYLGEGAKVGAEVSGPLQKEDITKKTAAQWLEIAIAAAGGVIAIAGLLIYSFYRWYQNYKLDQWNRATHIVSAPYQVEAADFYRLGNLRRLETMPVGTHNQVLSYDRFSSEMRADPYDDRPLSESGSVHTPNLGSGRAGPYDGPDSESASSSTYSWDSYAWDGLHDSDVFASAEGSWNSYSRAGSSVAADSWTSEIAGSWGSSSGSSPMFRSASDYSFGPKFVVYSKLRVTVIGGGGSESSSYSGTATYSWGLSSSSAKRSQLIAPVVQEPGRYSAIYSDVAIPVQHYSTPPASSSGSNWPHIKFIIPPRPPRRR